MSSATNADVAKARNTLNGLPGPIPDGNGPTDQMSPRQRELDWFWGFYRCTNYDGRKCDWNGSPEVDPIERDMIATSGAIPPGFYDAGQTNDIPLKFRKPSTPYRLAKVIVNRFTSLLFSNRRHPKVTCEDPDTEDWLAGFCEATRYWARWAKARRYGGAMGTAIVSFTFSNGKPKVEVHDPRWCMPEFSDRSNFIVSQLEKRYQYSMLVRNMDGEWEERWFWYRRVIDDQTDTIWPKVAVDDGEPDWEHERSISKTHGIGECPVVWVQNEEVDESLDGDPDCHGCYEDIEDIDALLSQASRGTKANCDPTLHVGSEAEFASIEKGSGKAIQTEVGGTVNYIEITGAGIDRAMKLADLLQEKVLTVSRCALDRNEGGPAKTEEEIEQNYSSMFERADDFREQYGENGAKRLLQMVLRYARRVSQARPEKNELGVTRIVRDVIVLPKKLVKNEETGKVTYVERKLGAGMQIDLVWPDYTQPSQDVITKAVNAAGEALTFHLIDQRHATQHVASYFQVEDVPKMLEHVKTEKQEEREAQQGPGNDLASKVTERTLAGAKSPLPNPMLSLKRKALLSG